MTNIDIMIFLKCVASDAIASSAFQTIFLALFLYAFVKDRGWFTRNTGFSATVN